jgi:hypothetical protein
VQADPPGNNFASAHRQRDSVRNINLFMAAVRVVAWERTSVIFPGQWEGTIADGREIYIRHRFDRLGFGIGADLAGALANYTTVGERPSVHQYGFMKDSEMITAMQDLGVSFENAERRGAPCEEY